MDRIKHLNDFQVIEFRRYIVKEGQREHFAEYFESYFPEAFQQMGAIAFGQFLERKNPVDFTWIRGFKNNDARAIINAGFYYGALWKEQLTPLAERSVQPLSATGLLRTSPELVILDPARRSPLRWFIEEQT